MDEFESQNNAPDRGNQGLAVVEEAHSWHNLVVI